MPDPVSPQRAALQVPRAAFAQDPAEHRWQRARPVSRWVATALLASLLGGCGAFSGGSEPPPQKEPVRLDIAIAADPDLNVDLKGRGAPMLLRVYELKADVAFREADFFALQKSDKAALGSDLLAVDQFIVRPGETRKIFRKANPESTAIGFFAGYRDLPSATWRVVHKLPAEPEKRWYRVFNTTRKLRLSVDLQKNAVVVTDLDTGTRPVQYANESLKELEAPVDEAPRSPADAKPKSADAPASFTLPQKPALEIPIPKPPSK